jgi:hypothetical protein
LSYSSKLKQHSSENLYRNIYYLGSLANVFVVSLFDHYTQHATLQEACAHRDHLESPEGKQERIQREERRQARIAYDLAREERNRLESAVKQITREELKPEYWDESDEVQYV